MKFRIYSIVDCDNRFGLPFYQPCHETAVACYKNYLKKVGDFTPTKLAVLGEFDSITGKIEMESLPGDNGERIYTPIIFEKEDLDFYYNKYLEKLDIPDSETLPEDVE